MMIIPKNKPNPDNIWKFIKFSKKIPKGKLIPKLKTGCWIWTGGKNDKGYGNFWYNMVTFKAHRFVYEYCSGEGIPEGLVLDHLCRKPICVSPYHLKPKTQKENCSDGLTGKINNWQKKKTHCIKGHPYNKKNTGLVLHHGGLERYCKICNREKALKNYYDKNKVAVA